MMGRKFMAGGAAKDAPRDPLRAEYWAGAPYRIPFTKKIREFPDLTASPLGKAFNMMGLVYSVPFRRLVLPMISLPASRSVCSCMKRLPGLAAECLMRPLQI